MKQIESDLLNQNVSTPNKEDILANTTGKLLKTGQILQKLII